jgi:hypothetical protein
MMNSKQWKKIGLGLLVLVVWGTIAYRVVSELTANDVPDEIPVQRRTIQTGLEVERKEFAIYADYADPFLKQQKEQPRNEQVRERNQPTGGYQYRRRDEYQRPANNRKNEVSVPEMRYLGLIKQADGKRELGMLQIEQSKALVKAGDSLMKVNILALYPDSLLISIGNKKKAIPISTAVETKESVPNINR